jgi:hypothetical protein
MEVAIRKLSDIRHSVTVTRADGSTETVELDSKDFLRHDLAHFAVEVEIGFEHAVWGSVARGGSLDGTGIDGPDVGAAESLAGPIQTLKRTSAGPDQVLEALRRFTPEIASPELANRLHQRMRALTGHWAATRYGHEMTLTWPFSG